MAQRHSRLAERRVRFEKAAIGKLLVEIERVGSGKPRLRPLAPDAVHAKMGNARRLDAELSGDLGQMRQFLDIRPRTDVGEGQVGGPRLRLIDRLKPPQVVHQDVPRAANHQVFVGLRARRINADVQLRELSRQPPGNRRRQQRAVRRGVQPLSGVLFVQPLDNVGEIFQQQRLAEAAVKINRGKTPQPGHPLDVRQPQDRLVGNLIAIVAKTATGVAQANQVDGRVRRIRTQFLAAGEPLQFVHAGVDLMRLGRCLPLALQQPQLRVQVFRPGSRGFLLPAR